MPLTIVAFAGLPRPVRATVIVLLAMMFFTVLTVIIRMATESLPVLVVVFFRNIFALIILLPLLARYGVAAIQSRHLVMHSVRSVLGLGAMIAGFTALTLIPLSEATALNFTMPLFATLGAVVFLGERIRTRRVVALLIGFGGMLVILRPGLEAVSTGALLAVLGAILIAASTILAKQLTHWERPLTIALWMVIMQTPLSLGPALLVWQWPDTGTLVWLLLLAVVGLVAHLLWIHALALADVSQLQPFEFLRLPLVALAGYLLFAETTTIWIWVGSAVIVISSVYIARREAQSARTPA